MLWTIVVILLVLWALGFFVAHLGTVVHLLLLFALIAIVYNLMTGRKAV